MQEKLLRYYSQHCSLFLENFNQALSGFDNEAVHDMRVAVKRLRAINLLLERLFPGKVAVVESEMKSRNCSGYLAEYATHRFSSNCFPVIFHKPEQPSAGINCI